MWIGLNRRFCLMKWFLFFLLFSTSLPEWEPTVFFKTFGANAIAVAADRRDASMIEVVQHGYSIDETWEKIGKTKYIWRVTFQNHAKVRKRVYAYYYLLDAEGVPLARNVANRYVGPGQTVEIIANSYIMTFKVPEIDRSEVKLKVGFPN